MKPIKYFVHAPEFTQEVYDKMTAIAGELDYSFEKLNQKLQEGYVMNLIGKGSHASEYALIRLPVGRMLPDFCSYRHIEHYLDSYDWINLGASGHSAAEHLFIRQLEE